jgi:hypothetical protein
MGGECAFSIPRKRVASITHRQKEMENYRNLNQAIRQLDLVNIELRPRMTGVKRDNLLNQILLVIVEDFNIEIVQEIQVHLVTIIPDAHHKRATFVQDLDLLVE